MTENEEGIPSGSEVPRKPDEQCKEIENMAEAIQDVPIMSKTQRKRMARLESMLENRKIKRKREKDRKKEKKALQKELGIEPASKKPLKHEMCDSACKIRVCVDMAYEELMNESLIRKTLSQLNFCYAANRRAKNPLQFYVSNMQDQTKHIFNKTPGNAQWDVFVREEPLSEIWPKASVVYLSSESENVLEKLDASKAYIIGGLVDHNSHKGVCHSRAVKEGFNHARLPIDEFVKLKTRKVLTINHVFEILLHFSEFGNWEEAFFSVIPKRKGMEKLEQPEQPDIVDLTEDSPE